MLDEKLNLKEIFFKFEKSCYNGIFKTRISTFLKNF